MPRLLPSRSVLLYLENSFITLHLENNLSQLRSPNHNFIRFYRRETPPNRVYSWYFATKQVNCLFKSLVPRLLPFRSVRIYSNNGLSQFTYPKYNFKWFYRRETPPNRVYSWYFATKALNCLFKSLVPRLLPSRSVLLYLENSFSQFAIVKK